MGERPPNARDPNKVRCPLCRRRMRPSVVEDLTASFVCENHRCQALGAYVVLATPEPGGFVSALRRVAALATADAADAERAVGRAAVEDLLSEEPGDRN